MINDELRNTQTIPNKKENNEAVGAHQPYPMGISGLPSSALLMHRGYIKLWRKMSDWGWYKDSKTKSLFLHLLFLSNHKKSDYLGHSIGRGQCIIGRKTLAKTLGMSEQSIRTALKHLKSTNEITIKPYNKFSIATITKYDFYQLVHSQITTELTNNQPATNQQLTTSKEYKNVKNDKNIISQPSATEVALKEIYKEGFNVYSLIGKMKNKLGWAKDRYFPDEVLLELCQQYHRDKESIDKPWPWFVKVLGEKSAEYYAQQNISENKKDGKIAQSIKDIMKEVL